VIQMLFMSKNGVRKAKIGVQRDKRLSETASSKGPVEKITQPLSRGKPVDTLCSCSLPPGGCIDKDI